MCLYLETGSVQGELQLNGVIWPGRNHGCVLMRRETPAMRMTEEGPCEDRARKQLSTGRRTRPQGRPNRPAPSFGLGASRAVRTHVCCLGRQVSVMQPSPSSRCSSALLHVQDKLTPASLLAGVPLSRIMGLGGAGTWFYICITQKGMWFLSLRLHCS